MSRALNKFIHTYLSADDRLADHLTPFCACAHAHTHGVIIVKGLTRGSALSGGRGRRFWVWENLPFIFRVITNID